MPTLVDAETNERDELLAFVEAQRGGLRRAVRGLSDEQAAAHPTASALSLGGLVKHAAACETSWIQEILLGRDPERAASPQGWTEQFQLLPGESVEQVLADLEEVARATALAVASLPDLDVEVPLPSAPWFPEGATRSARWILMHLVEEHARHAGHADIIRESLDGAVAFQLVADERADAQRNAPAAGPAVAPADELADAQGDIAPAEREEAAPPR